MNLSNTKLTKTTILNRHGPFSQHLILESATTSDNSFNSFTTIDLEQLIPTIIYRAATCIRDPISTKPLKDTVPLISTFFSDMINSSLITGYIPQAFKISAIKPPLKKANA